MRHEVEVASSARLTGTVVAFQSNIFKIRCDTEIGHLQILYVPGHQTEYQVGERVALEYRSSPTHGYWSFIK